MVRSARFTRQRTRCLCKDVDSFRHTGPSRSATPHAHHRPTAHHRSRPDCSTFITIHRAERSFPRTFRTADTLLQRCRPQVPCQLHVTCRTPRHDLPLSEHRTVQSLLLAQCRGVVQPVLSHLRPLCCSRHSTRRGDHVVLFAWQLLYAEVVSSVPAIPELAVLVQLCRLSNFVVSRRVAK